MAKIDYLAQGNAAFAAQQISFMNGVGSYAGVLGLTPAEVAAQAADAEYSVFTGEWQNVLQNAASQAVAWSKIIRDGGSPPPAGAPVAPTLPAAVPAVAPGIEGRFRNLVRKAKAGGGYNAAIGKALSIEGSEQGGADTTTITPEISATLTGGQVRIDWGWQGHGNVLDMIEIQVDRGVGFALLTYDTTPGYIDTTPLPATPVKWTYKAIYRVGDSQVGQWSPEISLSVGG
jgi:hypothetical protein